MDKELLKRRFFVKYLQLTNCEKLKFDADYNIIEGNIIIGERYKFVPGDYKNLTIYNYGHGNIIMIKGLNFKGVKFYSQSQTLIYDGEGTLPDYHIGTIIVRNITKDITIAATNIEIAKYRNDFSIDLQKYKVQFVARKQINSSSIVFQDLSILVAPKLYFSYCTLPKTLETLNESVTHIEIVGCNGLEDLTGGENLKSIKVVKSGTINVPDNLNATTINVKDRKSKSNNLESDMLHQIKALILKKIDIEIGKTYTPEELRNRGLNYTQARYKSYTIDSVSITWEPGIGGKIVLKSKTPTVTKNIAEVLINEKFTPNI